MSKPFSQACENNKQPILQFLRVRFSNVRHVLEIGSGTGQHAVYFAPSLSPIVWQCSDMPHNHAGINAWIDEFPCDNLRRPLNFTVGEDDWPDTQADAVFTANTTHIMQPQQARLMMEMVAEHLPCGGVFCQYGPFNIDGQYTSDSNEQFDLHLKAQGYGGIRDINELQDWLAGTSLSLGQRVQMPANNQLLVWQKMP
ncbi:DUF938 domain-containing protein [Bowmanella denitrificans]|uniref:DUF938 domain-containing protein n=1 Tax=Bowmanella denitrificans TaxID=366582 RepID=UPI000C9D1B1E|nr:DUF938 domain-containing protein [Bowmanella denitrificans]